MNLITCLHCGAELSSAGRSGICPRCGREARPAGGTTGQASPGELACPKCNYVLAPFETVCPRCGSKPKRAAGDQAFRPVVIDDGVEQPAEQEAPQVTAPIGPRRMGDQAAPKPSPMIAPQQPQQPSSDASGFRRLGGPVAPPSAPARPKPGEDAPWGVPPPTSRDIRSTLQDRNTSGTGAGAPREIGGWNWGAFFLHFVWGIAHSVWVSLLVFVPVANLVMPFVLGAKGNLWAWQHRRFESIDEFKQTQRVWAWVGLAVFLIWCGILVLQMAAITAALRHAVSGLPIPTPESSAPTP